MTDDVKRFSSRHAARRAGTEERIVRAAHELFLRDGWAATTLAAVAAAAQVADRTVYVRFGTKAELLKRTVDVAVVGDFEDVDLLSRSTTQRAFTAATLAERISAFAATSRGVIARLAGIVEVARQAEPTEPLIAAAAAEGRRATADQVVAVWRQLAADGLLTAGVDVEWAAATTGLLAHIETYLLLAKTQSWDLDQYQDWTFRTWWLLATTPSPAQSLPAR